MANICTQEKKKLILKKKNIESSTQTLDIRYTIHQKFIKSQLKSFSRGQRKQKMKN